MLTDAQFNFLGRRPLTDRELLQSLLSEWTLTVGPIAAAATCRQKSDPPEEPSVIWRDAFGLAIARPGPTRFMVRFEGLAAVDVDMKAKTIVAALEPGVPEQTLYHCLLDQIVPRIFAQQGRMVIHGGAIAVGDRAIVFVGASGRGKSTLTASFDQGGHRLIGDDALLVTMEEERLTVAAVYPSLRLLPDSVDALFDQSPGTRSVAHYSAKRRIALAPADAGPVPVQSVYILDAPSDGAIAIRPATPAETCVALIENSFALDPTDIVLARRKMELSASIAATVPAFRLSYPRDYSALPWVRAAMLDRSKAAA